MSNLKLINSTKLHLTVILILTFLAYSNIFQNSFAGDDRSFIVNWETIHHLESIPKILAGDLPRGFLRTYKPIRNLIVDLLYQVSLDQPFLYHLYTIVVHLSNTILVYFISLEIFKNLKSSILNHKSLAFITALLFGLHPIHTEAVTFIISGIDSTAYAFFFGSFYYYIRAKPPRRINNIWPSLLLATAAIFTTEMALTIPFILILYDLLFRNLKIKNLFRLKAFTIYLPFFLSLFFYLFIRIGILKIVSGGHELIGGSFYLTSLTMLKALFKYFFELILPINLSAYPHIASGIESYVGDFAPKEKILSQSIFDLDIIARIIILIFIIFIAYRARKKFPLISFSIGWVLITFLPASNIIPLGNIMQERYAYLPSLGFCLLLALGLNWLYEFKTLKIKIFTHEKIRGLTPKILISTAVAGALLIFFILYSTFYFYQTYQRNKDWKDSITFLSKLSSQVPKNPLIAYYLASEYEFSNQDNKAIEYFQKAYDLAPNTPDVNFRLGKLYQKQANLDLAKKYYLKTLELYSDFSTSAPVLDKYATLKEASPGAIFRSDGKWLKFQDQNMMFFYPEGWQLSRLNNDLQILGKKIRITVSLMGNEISFDQIKAEREPEILKEEGQASIPNFQGSYLKVYETEEGLVYILYLQSSNRVLKVIVHPVEPSSEEMKLFEQFLLSIRTT